MSEANFEKNIQQEMQGFKVKPSEEVWVKVEERIRKKKQRRIFFILFFGAIALLGYWQRDVLFSEKEPAMKESVLLPKEKISTDDSIKNTIPGNIIQADLADENIEKKKNILTKNEQQPEPVREKIITVRKVKPIKEISELGITQKNQISEKPVSANAKSAIEQTVETQILKDIAVVKIDAENKINDSKEFPVVTSDSATPKEIEKISDSIVQAESKFQVDSLQKPESIADPMAETKKQPAISKKWKWGVQFAPGISSLVNQTISFSGNKSADLASAPPGGFPVPPAAASGRNSGFAFQIGGFVQKRISAKTEFSLGLQYSYYSDRIRVGDFRLLNQGSSQPQPLFGATQGYRAANPGNSFTNRYHFIELPINFLFQINKNAAKPLYLDLGIKTGRMISSNTLVYDTAFGGIYYENKDQFKKTQFSLSPGLLWTFSSKNIQWSVGPVLNVHISRFLDNSFEGEKYLLMPGIRTKILFPERK